MTISDEQVMAYVDGELDAQTRNEVERAMESDPEVARRVERQRELRNKLRAAFNDVLNEPVPDRLVSAARNAPVVSASEHRNVADLAEVRDRKAGLGHAARRWSWPEWSAIAASLVLGAFIAQLLWHSPELMPFTEKNGRLVAQATLAQALTNQLAGSPSAAGRYAHRGELSLQVGRLLPHLRDARGRRPRRGRVSSGRRLDSSGFVARRRGSGRNRHVQPGGILATCGSVANGRGTNCRRAAGRRGGSSRTTKRLALKEQGRPEAALYRCDPARSKQIVRSTRPAIVVLVAINALALAILGALDALLLTSTHTAVGSSVRLVAHDTRLAALE